MHEKGILNFSFNIMEHDIKLKVLSSYQQSQYMRGTVYVVSSIGTTEKVSVIYFQKSGEFKETEFERAKILTNHYVSKLKNIKIHPVLITQLILTLMNASLVFHYDKSDRHPETKFHAAFFRFNTLIKTFTNISLNVDDEYKKPKEFKKSQVLSGLWRKHVEDASLSGLAQNIRMSNKRNGWLVQKCKEEFGVYDASKINERKLDEFIRDQMFNKGFTRRQNKRRMTGEWLIFDKTEKGIHFLTLASHQESDEQIIARI